MSALFNLESLSVVVLLVICACTYFHMQFPSVFDRNKSGVFGVFWKAARIGERLSPFVSVLCLVLGMRAIFA
ncbi:MAG: DUF1242 family protein, secretory pathway component Ksh1 [Amphiamblys sp. WSBS2006]|nr:MAG: DUF1242 family protein, secretory pathway component Ksh1 [Amphiamblys sp. WSBS2006]